MAALGDKRTVIVNNNRVRAVQLLQGEGVNTSVVTNGGNEVSEVRTELPACAHSSALTEEHAAKSTWAPSCTVTVFSVILLLLELLNVLV